MSDTMKEYIAEAEKDLLHTYNRYQIVLDKGDGVYLYDTDGKKYLDFVAGIAVFALGYQNKAYNDALKAQIDKVIHTSNYYYNVPAIEAARKIKKVSGMDRVFFTNSGAEAVEGAIKAARKYAYLKDGCTDHEIIAMNHSFHGRTMGALSVTVRSLKSDTLLIIDNFNVTSTQDSCLSVVLKYRCRVLFTTRSQLSEYCSFQLKELKDIPTLFQLTSVFYSEAEENRAIVEKIIETVHYHTFAVELAAKLLENGILTPEQLLIKLQEEKASLHNEDKIKVMKDGQSKKATYYNHIHTLFSLYSLSRKQQDIMCNMCFMPSSGISARIFSKWLELPTLNDVNDLIETGFVQSSLRHTISLHPMIQEIAVSETAPSVTSCHTLLDSLQKICLMHGIEVSYYKKLFQTAENIIQFIEKDDIPQYLLFLEDVFPYMEKYHYQKGMKKIIQELQHFIKANTYGTASDRALLLDYQATLEPQTEKAIKLEKEALAQIKETTKENAHLVSNLHSNLGGLYRINGQLDLAKRHMKMGISLLQQYQLLYTNDSIPQINNYAVLLIEIQEPDLALSALQKLAQIIKEYNSNHCLDYAQVQESLGSICLITANISQAKTHFKKALKIYEDIWADEPELIEEKYQAIQELYPQAGIALAKSILLTKH